MLKVAVTGSIASGKSLFASLLESRGAVVIDADLLGHELIRKTGSAYAPVLGTFGPDILGPDGEIDRKVLGRKVFADPAARERLNGLVHPALIAELARRIEGAERSGAQGAIVDAALVYELGLADAFDAVIVVTSPVERQIERLLGRGLDEAEARKRIAAQLDQGEKSRRGDFHVVNAGTRESLEAEAERVWNAIRRLDPEPKKRGL